MFEGKLVTFKGRMPNCQQVKSFAGEGHFQSLFEMGLEEDARLLKEQEGARKDREVDGDVQEGEEQEVDRKGAKGWRYGPVSPFSSVSDGACGFFPCGHINFQRSLLQYIQNNFGSRGPADVVELKNGPSEGQLTSRATSNVSSLLLTPAYPRTSRVFRFSSHRRRA